MNVSDIKVGIVNSFPGREITRRIQNGVITELQRRNHGRSRLPYERRLFVCVAMLNGRGQWAEITSNPGNSHRRQAIRRSWRTWEDGDAPHNPMVAWKKNPQYINSAVFEGPDAVWAALATDMNTAGGMKKVTDGGIQAIKNNLNNNILVNPLFP